MELAAQLFTVHDYTKNLKDFDETLKKVSDIGYKFVQVSGTCPFSPYWLKATLDKYGLKCILTHNGEDALKEAAQYIAKDHDIYDCKYIGVGGLSYFWMPEYDLKNFIKDFNENILPVAKTLKECGKYFMYHNHDHEFVKDEEKGKTYYELLAESTDPELVGFTVDTFWVQAGGKDPAKIIRSLKGRCPVVHFKDYKMVRGCEERYRMAPCGDGALDFKDIIDACREAGVEYVAVEQDNCYGDDPFECLERSYKYLKSLGL